MKRNDVNFPNVPKLSADWAKSVTALNTWLQAFRDFIGASPPTRIVDIDFVAPAQPSTVIELGKRPIGVELLALWSVDSQGGLTYATPPALSWNYSGKTLVLPSFAGLTPTGRKYRAVVRITEDR